MPRSASRPAAFTDGAIEEMRLAAAGQLMPWVDGRIAEGNKKVAKIAIGALAAAPGPGKKRGAGRGAHPHPARPARIDRSRIYATKNSGVGLKGNG